MVSTTPAAKMLDVATERIISDTEQLYGVELEIEGPDPMGPIMSFNVDRTVDWEGFVRGQERQYRFHTDGSLRGYGAAEIITMPASMPECARRLNRVYNHIADHPPGAVTYGTRCSLHVHANMLWATMYDVVRISVLYAAMEPWLMAAAGDARVANQFCIPWCLGPTPARTLADAYKGHDSSFSNTDYLRDVFRQFPKYSALNLRTVGTIGTMEFRLAPAYSDPSSAGEWLNALSSIVSYFSGINTALLVRHFMRRIDDDPEGFAAAVLGGEFVQKHGGKVRDEWLALAQAVCAMFINN